jgi:hypothetical protein
MKGISLTIVLFVLSCAAVFSQTGTTTGIITSVKPHFADTYELQVGTEQLILIPDPKDKTGKSFEINRKYKDLIVEKEGVYILNPKYAGKTFILHYTVNGKGWKCIQSVKAKGK